MLIKALFALGLCVNVQCVYSKNEKIKQCKYDPVYSLVDVDLKKKNSQWSRNFNLYLSPYVLLQSFSKKQRKYTIVDVRSSHFFNQFHIDGSFNLPKEMLLTKTIFKNNKIVLIGNAFDNRYLEKLISKLKIKGFNNVSILDGGINYWKSQIKSNYSFSSNEIIIQIDKILRNDLKQWKIINTTKYSKINNSFPNVLSITDEKKLLNPEAYKDVLLSNETKIINILLVLNEKFYQQELINLWKKKINANIFVVFTPNIIRGLDNYLANQRLVSQKKRADGTRMTCLQ